MSKIVDTVFGSAPSAPDPTTSADAQAKLNKQAIYDSASVNQMTQRGPGFNIDYTGEVGGPDRTMTYSLSPERQALADTLGAGQQSTSEQITGAGPAIDPSIRAGEASDKMYAALSNRLQPSQDRRRDRTENMLTQRGMPIGQEGWNDTMQQVNQSEADEMMQAAMGAEQLGIQESGRLFGQDMTQRQDQRSQLATLLGADPTNSAQMPNQPAYQINPVDRMGSEMNNYNSQMNQYNSKMGGLASLGGAGMMAYALCHPSYKEEKQPIGDILPRIELLDIEAWKYKKGVADGGTAGFHIGPYADQFQKVFGIGDGVTINMMDAIGVCLAGLKETQQRFTRLRDDYLITV